MFVVVIIITIIIIVVIDIIFQQMIEETNKMFSALSLYPLKLMGGVTKDFNGYKKKGFCSNYSFYILSI